MLALLSPAKSLDYSSRIPDIASTDIRFPKQTKELARAAAKLKAADLKRIMHISDALAELNAGRYSDFFDQPRSEEHTSELQSLMRISSAVFCLNKKTHKSH